VKPDAHTDRKHTNAMYVWNTGC